MRCMSQGARRERKQTRSGRWHSWFEDSPQRSSAALLVQRRPSLAEHAWCAVIDGSRQHVRGRRKGWVKGCECIPAPRGLSIGDTCNGQQGKGRMCDTSCVWSDREDGAILTVVPYAVSLPVFLFSLVGRSVCRRDRASARLG